MSTAPCRSKVSKHFLPKLDPPRRFRSNSKSIADIKARLPQYFTNSPKFSIGGKGSSTGHGSYCQDLAHTPGPAAYNVPTNTRPGPSYSMSDRTHFPGNKMITPGPGAHNILHNTDFSGHKMGPSFGYRHSSKSCLWTEREEADRYMAYTALKKRSKPSVAVDLPPLKEQLMYRRGTIKSISRHQEHPRWLSNDLARDYLKGYYDTMTKCKSRSAY